MKRYFSLCLLLTALIQTGFSADTLRIDRFLYKEGITIFKPFSTDTINPAGTKVNNQFLLKTGASLSFPDSELQEIVLNNGAAYEMQLPSSGYGMGMIKFYFMATSFGKAKLETETNASFELYINGKKEGYKNTLEDSLSSGCLNSVDLTLEPKGYEVIYRFFVSEEQKQKPRFKASITTNRERGMFITTSLSPQNLLTPNYLLEGKKPLSASISPGGTHALITYSNVMSGTGASASTTELLDLRTNKPLSGMGGIKHTLTWMPRSNKYYYTKKNDDGERDLIMVDPIQSEESILRSAIPEGSFVFSPDEKNLIYSIYEHGEAEKGELMQLISPADRRPNYRNRYFLYKYDLATGMMQPLTFGLNSTVLNHISNCGKWILFSTTEETYTEWPLSVSTLYRMEIETMKVDTLLNGVKHISSAQFSPDGKSLLLFGNPESFEGIGKDIDKERIANLYEGECFLMDITTKKIKPITKNFNPSIKSATWSRFDPNKIYFNTADRDLGNVYEYNIKKSAYRQLNLQTEVTTMFSIAETAPTAIYFGQSGSVSPKVFSMDINKGSSTLLSFPKEEKYKELLLGELKEYNFKTNDGTTIYGRYYLPYNFDPTKKYPMIVYYYGGTTPVDRLFEHSYALHLYASLGFVVYCPQPSGAIGFGQEFAARHVNAWGDPTADEIIEGTRSFCQNNTYVDSTKIGCMGASYGGFMTMYIISKSNLFKAAISHAGISALSSYWGEGYWGVDYSSRATAGKFPWNNPDFYTNHSPLFKADKINTPLLLLHGAEDTNVPIGESIQMYNALKLLGKEVEFIKIKGEDHGVMNYKRKIQWTNTITAWFIRWLQEDEDWWNELYPRKNL